MKSNLAGFRLAHADSVIRIFNTMIYSIIQHMQQDRLDRIKHVAVKLNPLTLDKKPDLFVQVAGQIAQ